MHLEQTFFDRFQSFSLYPVKSKSIERFSIDISTSTFIGLILFLFKIKYFCSFTHWNNSFCVQRIVLREGLSFYPLNISYKHKCTYKINNAIIIIIAHWAISCYFSSNVIQPIVLTKTNFFHALNHTFITRFILFILLCYWLVITLNILHTQLFLQCGLTPQQLDMLKQTIKDCAGKEGASDADVQEIFDRQPPSSHGGRCTIACVAETAGMVSQLTWTEFNLKKNVTDSFHFPINYVISSKETNWILKVRSHWQQKLIQLKLIWLVN